MTDNTHMQPLDDHGVAFWTFNCGHICPECAMDNGISYVGVTDAEGNAPYPVADWVQYVDYVPHCEYCDDIIERVYLTEDAFLSLLIDIASYDELDSRHQEVLKRQVAHFQDEIEDYINTGIEEGVDFSECVLKNFERMT